MNQIIQSMALHNKYLNILRIRNKTLWLKLLDVNVEDLSNTEQDELAICARIARNKGE